MQKTPPLDGNRQKLNSPSNASWVSTKNAAVLKLRWVLALRFSFMKGRKAMEMQ